MQFIGVTSNPLSKIKVFSCTNGSLEPSFLAADPFVVQVVCGFLAMEAIEEDGVSKGVCEAERMQFEWSNAMFFYYDYYV